jgi:hypothetical protein
MEKRLAIVEPFSGAPVRAHQLGGWVLYSSLPATDGLAASAIQVALLIQFEH